jgi:hypothetical protein
MSRLVEEVALRAGDKDTFADVKAEEGIGVLRSE